LTVAHVAPHVVRSTTWLIALRLVAACGGLPPCRRPDEGAPARTTRRCRTGNSGAWRWTSGPPLSRPPKTLKTSSSAFVRSPPSPVGRSRYYTGVGEVVLLGMVGYGRRRCSIFRRRAPALTRRPRVGGGRGHLVVTAPAPPLDYSEVWMNSEMVKARADVAVFFGEQAESVASEEPCDGRVMTGMQRLNVEENLAKKLVAINERLTAKEFSDLVEALRQFSDPAEKVASDVRAFFGVEGAN